MSGPLVWRALLAGAGFNIALALAMSFGSGLLFGLVDPSHFAVLAFALRVVSALADIGGGAIAGALARRDGLLHGALTSLAATLFVMPISLLRIWLATRAGGEVELGAGYWIDFALWTAVGITRCVAYAFERLGEPVPGDDELRRWIGPPLRDSFAPMLGDAARVERAVEYYRERFEDIGYAEHSLYEGIADAIHALSERGHRIAVVTAKNEPHARKIVSGFDFADRFETIVGATVDGRISHKPELIGEALARLALHAEECVMIGDRHMDIDGARHHRMRSVGVRWGFGDAAELARADLHAEHPRDLLRVL